MSDKQEPKSDETEPQPQAADSAARDAADGPAESGDKDETRAELAGLAASADLESSAPAPARRSGGSSLVAWLALLLVFGLGGAAAWYYLQTQQRESALADRLAYLENTAAQLQTAVQSAPDERETLQEIRGVESSVQRLDSRTRELAALVSELQSRPQAGPATASGQAPDAGPTVDVAALTREWENKLAAEVTLLKGTDQRQSQQLQRLATELAAASEEPEVNINRDAWLMAEVQYLLRLANQRMIMAGDTVAAGALLASADSILRELDDLTLLDARRAVAEDLAAVRAVPRLDVEGMYLKLGALINQADALVIFELPDTVEGSERVEPETWRERLLAGWESALQTLSSYIVVRRRDTPMEALMDPHWERMVRQNLRMLLEQSQIALLTGNQVLFEESLQRTRHWVAEFFVTDEAAARALSADLDELMQQTIAVELPDISGSLRAFDAAMARKHGAGGAG